MWESGLVHVLRGDDVAEAKQEAQRAIVAHLSTMNAIGLQNGTKKYSCL